MYLPYLVFADQQGNIYHHPFLRMAVRSLNDCTLPKESELIRIPPGSSLFYLPQRHPVGFNPKTKKFETLRSYDGKEVFALAAFLVPAYLRLHSPAAVIKRKVPLPLWAYTACGFKSNRFFVAACRVDKRVRQSPRFYNNTLIKKSVKVFLKKFPQNRLCRHLANCALNYNCLAAKNMFLKRWEAPLPTARSCNAKCIGCLSHQEGDCVSSHSRIAFQPRVREVVQVMQEHLSTAKEPIVSFGQGCEGEPLLEANLIAESIAEVRRGTKRGTININTNASIPEKIELLSRAGADSFRVSLNSPTEKFYNIYFRPRNYRFSQVLKSIEIAKSYNKFVSLNLFVFPGLSDAGSEIKALIKLIKKTKVDMIQWRNLNIDPEGYLDKIKTKGLKPKGVSCLLQTVKKEFPKLKTGYFNLPRQSW